MSRKTAIIGDKYHRLLVTSNPYKKEGNRRYFVDVLCDCGTSKSVQEYLLRTGNTKSCGCLRSENTADLKLSHGLSRSPTYIAWRNMKVRCSDPDYKQYHDYGGRGITYDPRWESFENFLEDMGEKPGEMTLDRIDVNRNYCKENCRWEDIHTQVHNRRKTRSSSKYMGVSFCKNTNKWISKLVYKGKPIIFERFEDEREAALAYDEVSYKVYGDRPNQYLIKE